MIGGVDGQLQIGLECRHRFGHDAGLLALVVEAFEGLLQFGFQLLVFRFALAQLPAQLNVLYAGENVVDGRYAHPDAGVTFAKQTDGILFNHEIASFSVVSAVCPE